MEGRVVEVPLRSREIVKELRVGDIVWVSGVVVTMRDLAHRRALELLEKGEEIPFAKYLRNGAIFHAGPIAREVGGEWRIVSIGPTTSARMDRYAYDVVKELGVAVILGKGGMGEGARRACRELGAVYLELVGGTASLITKSVKRVLEVHWLDLGIPEAAWVLEVELMGPCIVAIDSGGRDVHEEVMSRARAMLSEVVEHALPKGLGGNG